MLARALTSAAIFSLAFAASGCTGGEDEGGGASRSFWTWDLSVMPPVDAELEATERATTEHFHVFVEDALWDSGEVTEAQLADLVATLEDSTPAGSIDPASGILENDVAMFGPVPDALDGDPRVYLLLMNIEGFQNFEFDGFFRAIDQMTDEDALDTQGYHSNEVEILYVNAEIRPVNSETTESVIAHELYHLLEWGLDPIEDGWLSEAMGELAMTINGFYTDDVWVEDFLAHPEEPLFGGQFSVHYGACLLFANYLHERFGGPFVSDLVSLESDGAASIDEALSLAGETATFESVFLDWVVANAVDAPVAGYGYEFAELDPPANWTLVTGTAGSTASILVDPWSTRYVKLEPPGGAFDYGLTVTTGNASAARLALVLRDSADPADVLVTFPAVDADNSTFVQADVTGTYDEAWLALVGAGAGTTFQVAWAPN